eukprot:2285260-Pleurochrysis_carterae.AAC.1
MDPHRWLREELDLDMNLPDKAQLCREWRNTAFRCLRRGRSFCWGRCPTRRITGSGELVHRIGPPNSRP